MSIFLFMGMANGGPFNTKLQCLESTPVDGQSSQEQQEQVVCTDIQELKDVNGQRNWKHLIVFNENKQAFQINGKYFENQWKYIYFEYLFCFGRYQ